MGMPPILWLCSCKGHPAAEPLLAVYSGQRKGDRPCLRRKSAPTPLAHARCQKTAHSANTAANIAETIPN
jgi:hypothetical protein